MIYIPDKARKKRAKEEHDLYRDEPRYPHKRIIFHLPLPPSVNHMYINTRRGGKVLTKTAEGFIAYGRARINEAIEDQHWMMQDHAVWYYADLVFYMPDRKIRDSHNMNKLLLDIMEGILFSNDYYCMPRVQGVEYDVENPRVEVKLSPQTRNQRQKALTMTKLA